MSDCERIRLSTLVDGAMGVCGMRIAPRTHDWQGGPFLVLFGPAGEELARVHVEEVYDPNGMRFEDDLS